jgi:hypothetical protein
LPTRAELFWAKAEECEMKAEAAQGVDAKRMYHQAAQHWRAMAEQAERLGW